MQQHTFIYAIRDMITGNIVYIGKSNQPTERFKSHLRSRRFRHQKSSLELVILECTSLADWKECERKWIAFGRSSNYPLTNLLDGGDGQTGCITEVSNRNALLSYLKSKQF